MSKKVKITVLKKEFYPELADRFLTDGREIGLCDFFEEGDSFLYEGSAVMPEGFCPWAWRDICGSVGTVEAGGTFTPWNNADGQTVVCCTDGIRPVVFLVEADGEAKEEVIDVGQMTFSHLSYQAVDKSSNLTHATGGIV